MKKILALSAALSALVVPTTAFAGPAGQRIATCQAAPVTTPGVTVMGHRVPSVSGITVCVVSDTVADVVPSILDQPECGSPCFTVEIKGFQVSESLSVTVDLKLDGQTQHYSVAPDTIAVDPVPGSGLCVVGVGTPDPCTDRVTTPSDLTAKAMAGKRGSRISLGWGASETTRDATLAGYQIWRSLTNEPGSFEQVATSTTTSFVDHEVTPGTTYHYYVVAWDSAGNYSPASNSASARAR